MSKRKSRAPSATNEFPDDYFLMRVYQINTPHAKYSRHWRTIKELACRRLGHSQFTDATLNRLYDWLIEECGRDYKKYEYLRIPDVIRLLDNESPPRNGPPPMTPDQRLVFDLLARLPAGDAMTGREIIGALKEEKEIEQSTLTSRVIPFLKKHYNVKNRPGAGYYVDQT